jgi:hypothetical protein
MVRKVFADNLEAVVWTSALVWLAVSDPAGGAHFSLCPLRSLGFDWCPGCGLGRAVSYAFHGELAESFRQHFLGIPAIVILTSRVVVLAKERLTRYIKMDHITIPQRNPYAKCNAVNAGTGRRRNGFRPGLDQGFER